jgi:hypothetical protein
MVSRIVWEHQGSVEKDLCKAIKPLKASTPLVEPLYSASIAVLRALRDSLEEVIKSYVPNYGHTSVKITLPTIQEIRAAERLVVVHMVLCQRGADDVDVILWPERLTSLRRAVDIVLSTSFSGMPNLIKYLVVLVRMLTILRDKKTRLPHTRMRAFRTLIGLTSDYVVKQKGITASWTISSGWDVAHACFYEGRWPSALQAATHYGRGDNVWMDLMFISCTDMCRHRHATQGQLNPICEEFGRFSESGNWSSDDMDKCITQLESYTGPTSPSLALFLGALATKYEDGSTALRRLAVILRGTGMSAKQRTFYIKYIGAHARVMRKSNAQA